MSLQTLQKGYVLANERLLKFVKSNEREKYIGHFTCDVETYPVNYILIGYHGQEKVCAYQRVMIQNEEQKRALLEMCKSCANVIYAVDFVACDNIRQDYILTILQLDAIFKLK